MLKVSFQISLKVSTVSRSTKKQDGDWPHTEFGQRYSSAARNNLGR